MDDKVLVRLGHGYYNGGITPLPDVCPTIDAHIDCWHILIGEKMKNEDIRCECVGMLGGEKYEKKHDIARRVYDTNGIAPTQHTCGGGNLETKVVIVDGFNQSIRADQTCFGTITRNAGVSTKHYIRKLTPKECGRLMGVRDDDIDKMSVNQSNFIIVPLFRRQYCG